MLDQKLSEAKSKKDTLKARAKSAQTSKQIQDMVQGLNTSNAMAAFDRMEEKVMALEAESEATLQVYRSFCEGLRSCHCRPAQLLLLMFSWLTYSCRAATPDL